MSGPYMSNSTSLRHTPESITVWILSLGPSDRYESAQQASARTSGSLLKSNMESTLRHGDTCEETTVVWSCYKGIKRFTQRECVCVVMITYNIYIVIRETGQFSSKGIINDFLGNLNRLTVSRRFTEQAV